MNPIVPAQFGIPGGPELLVILLIAVLLFGANKIPKLARSTGEAMSRMTRSSGPPGIPNWAGTIGFIYG